jgi:hypothetical protein
MTFSNSADTPIHSTLVSEPAPQSHRASPAAQPARMVSASPEQTSE